MPEQPPVPDTRDDAELYDRPPVSAPEPVPQATQREITLASLALVKARRPDVHVFNELLVQYPVPRQKKPDQVVPDNMVVLHAGPLNAEDNYVVSLQPARPFWVLEYVSKSNRRKDYDDNLDKYEHQLKVPFYLRFQSDMRELTLYRHTRRKYVSVKPNDAERLALPELELEVALLDGWVRYWFRGALLPLPAELQGQLDELRRERDDLRRERHEAHRRAEQADRARSAAEEELARLRAEMARLKRKRNPRG